MRRGAAHDATRDAHAVRLQRLGESSVGRRSVQPHGRAVRPADGLELWLRSRYAGPYLWRRMGLAGALPGPLAGIAPGYDAIQRRGELAGALERTRAAPAW